MTRFGQCTVYWSPQTGPAPVYGAILEHYLASGGSAALGLPLAGEEGFGGRGPVMRRSRFERASVYWTPALGPHTVVGAVRDEYAGYLVTAALGAPLTDEADVPGGRGSTFEHGRILWSAGTGAHAVYGGIGDAYLAVGASGGRLGLPTIDEYGSPDGPRQDFQHGRITFTSRGAVVSQR